MELLLATRNGHKARELRPLLGDLPLELLTLEQFPAVPSPEEDGGSFQENAAKKALHAARACGLWSLADDSGLEVEALGGAPGVRSARYAGDGAGDAANNRKLLEALRGVPRERRRAAFRCVLALASPDGLLQFEEGRLEGSILESPRGEDGFGYDPLFLLPERGRALAELPLEEKNALSHRSRALARMRPRLEALAGKPCVCPRCGLLMRAWHCRMQCPGCGLQFDCSDPF